MSLVPSLFKAFGGNGLLSKPGDKLSARVTKSGRQVVKLDTSTLKRSAVRYPETGTVVETIVRKVSQ